MIDNRAVRVAAIRIALTYAVFAGLWIVFSDRALVLLDLDGVNLVQTYKGLLFVIVTTCVLYVATTRWLFGVVRATAEADSIRVQMLRVNDTVPVGLLIVNVDGSVEYANAATYELFSKQSNSILEFYPGWFDEDGRVFDIERDLLVRVFDGQRVIDFRIQSPEEPDRVHTLCAAPLTDTSGAIDGLVVTITDISERVALERKAAQLARTYLIFAEVGRLLASSNSAKDVLAGVCSVAVKAGSFEACCVLSLENEEDTYVSTSCVVSGSDFKEVFADLSLKDLELIPTTSAPSDTCIRVHNNLLAGDPKSRLTELARSNHLGSSASLPVIIGEDLVAVVTLFSSEPGFFDDSELQLLERVRSDIVVALSKIVAEHEQRIAENNLIERESQYRRLFVHNPNPMFIYDPESLRFLSVNDAAVEHYGYTSDEFRAMTIEDIRPQDDLPAFRDYISTGEDDVSRKGEWIHLTKTGNRIDVEVSSNEIIWEGRKARLVLAHDVTHRIQAERELRDANRELADYRDRLEDLVDERTQELSLLNERLSRATRVKSEFLANMSHELRTPLNSIIGFSGIMLQRMAGDLNEEQEKQLGMVYRSGTHLLDLINDILDISKIEAGRIDVEASIFDLSDLLHEVVESMQPQAIEKGLVLELTLPDESVHPHTDRTKVRQVLTNLVGNAVKFTKEGRIDVILESDDGYFNISVRDTGPGVAIADRLLIFDEFQQASRRADDKPVGTGLGLAISRKLARMMGGDIELESTVDVGSIFTLRAPMVFKAPNRDVEDDNGRIVTDET